MFNNREIKGVLSKEADEIFLELKQVVGREKIRGIESSFHQTLLRSIERTIDLLKQNPFAGNQIPRRQCPKKYFEKYDAENVWRIELANRWRMIYTITGNELEVTNFIMDIFDHPDYDKVFGYKH